MKIIKGDTIEEQMKFVDRILSRFSRRLHKTVVGIVTPFPVSSFGNLKYMFPAAGTLTKGVIFIEDIPKDGVNVLLKLSNDLGVTTKEYFMKNNRLLLEPNMPVFLSDRIVIEVSTTDKSELIHNVYISFLWEPKVKESKIHRCLIDALDEVGEQNVLQE